MLVTQLLRVGGTRGLGRTANEREPVHALLGYSLLRSHQRLPNPGHELGNCRLAGLLVWKITLASGGWAEDQPMHPQIREAGDRLAIKWTSWRNANLPSS